MGDSIDMSCTLAYGGSGGVYYNWIVPDDHYIKYIEYRSGDRIDSLVFTTDFGARSPYFGGGGGIYHLVTIPDDYRIIGLYGRANTSVDQIGFWIAKTVYPAYG